MKKILLIVLVISIILVPSVAFADLGSFAGSMDFGSFSDFDVDFGSSYSGGDTYVYGGYYGGTSSGDEGDGLVIFIVFIVMVVAFVVLYFLGKAKKRKRANMPQGAKETPISELVPVSAFSALDENFDEAEFKEKVSNLYVRMQNAWQDKDLEPVRPYFTDAFFAQLSRQCEQMKKLGRTNYVDRIAVLGVDIRGFMQKNGEDHMIVTLRTRIVDYTLDDNTGKLVSGHTDKEKFMTYEWDMARASGKKTVKDGEMQRVSCPGCGAPLDINATAKCPYCDSIVTLDKHDWALVSIKGISQQTR